MKVRKIKQILTRWSIIDMHTSIGRDELNLIKSGEIVDVDNVSGMWLVAQGYCEHILEDNNAPSETE